MSYGGSCGQESDKNGLILLYYYIFYHINVYVLLILYCMITLLLIGISSYMDEIPVKIIEKYKPPKKIALPGVLQHKPSSKALKYQVKEFTMFYMYFFFLYNLTQNII